MKLSRQKYQLLLGLKPNIVEVFVEDFRCDILCEYVCNVDQGTDLVHC